MESIKIRLKEALEIIEKIENDKTYYETADLAQLDRTFLDLRKMTSKFSKMYSYEKIKQIQNIK